MIVDLTTGNVVTVEQVLLQQGLDIDMKFGEPYDPARHGVLGGSTDVGPSISELRATA